MDYRDAENPNMQVRESYRADYQTRSVIIGILLHHEKTYPTLWDRTMESIENEWLWHNLSYYAFYKRSNTAHVDIDNEDVTVYPRITPWG